jgi:hypothetical protein
VDLVLIATTQTVEAGALRTALVSEHRRRGTTQSVATELPSRDWHEGYRKIAAGVPNFEIHDADEAVEIVRRLVDPILAGRDFGEWDPARLEWRTT